MKKNNFYNCNNGSSVRKCQTNSKRLKRWPGRCVFVSEDGNYMEDADDHDVYNIKIIDGHKYGIAPWDDKGVFKVDMGEAVAVAWHKRPYNGHGHYVFYKDGDMTNCSKDNIEWKVVPTSDSQNTEDAVFSNDWIIRKNGEITIGGTKVEVWDSWFDDDVDLRKAFKFPKGVLFNESMRYPESVDVHEVLDDMGYVKGKKEDFDDPVVLHVDQDRMNFNSENLEWVNGDDPRFIEYEKKCIEYVKKRNLELNPGREEDLKYWKLI